MGHAGAGIASWIPSNIPNTAGGKLVLPGEAGKEAVRVSDSGTVESLRTTDFFRRIWPALPRGGSTHWPPPAWMLTVTGWLRVDRVCACSGTAHPWRTSRGTMTFI